jgi:lysozyme
MNAIIGNQAIQKAMQFLREVEGFELEAYDDGGGVLTIGIGHRVKAGEPHKITAEQAAAYLIADIQPALAVVGNLARTTPLNMNQIVALIAFAFNAGVAGFAGSTLYRKIEKQAPLKEIEFQWMRWKYDNGVIIDGLINRREAEFALFTCVRGL